MWSKYKVQSRGAWFKFWNSLGLLTGHFLPVPGAFTCVLLKFLSWIYIIFFYWVNSYLYDESRRYLISNTAPDLATWRPWQFAFKWPLIFGCSSAFFCALLPIFLLSFDLNLSFFRCSWLLVALWRVKKKHITRLQTTKVAKHPGASPAVLTRVGLQILTKHHNSRILCSPLGPRI